MQMQPLSISIYLAVLHQWIMSRSENLKPWYGEYLDSTTVFQNMAYIFLHKLMTMLYHCNFPSSAHSVAASSSCFKGILTSANSLILAGDGRMIFALFGFNFGAEGILLKCLVTKSERYGELSGENFLWTLWKPGISLAGFWDSA